MISLSEKNAQKAWAIFATIFYERLIALYRTPYFSSSIRASRDAEIPAVPEGGEDYIEFGDFRKVHVPDGPDARWLSIRASLSIPVLPRVPSSRGNPLSSRA